MYFTRKRLKLYLWALIVLELIICFGFRSSIRAGAIDFRLYYTAGHMLRTGNAAHLYDYATETRLQNALVAPQPIALPLLAPPFVALFFAPISLAPYLPALVVFGVVNVAALAFAVRAMRPRLRALSARWPLTVPLLFLSFLPAGLTLVMGQISILLLLVACLAFALLESGSAFLAGLVFSLSLMKFQIAIPVAALFLLWRHWRFLLGFLSGAAILSALSVLIIGVRGFRFYLHSIVGMSSLAGTPLQTASGLSPRRMANFHGLFSLAPTQLAIALTVVASIAVFAWAATRRPSFPLAVLVALLVSYHLYPCDLTLLLLPLSLLCDRLFAEELSSVPAKASRLQQYRRTILFCSIGVFLITPALIEIIVNNLIFLLALPILGLAVCPMDWSTLCLPEARTAHATPARTTA